VAFKFIYFAKYSMLIQIEKNIINSHTKL